MIIEYRKKSNKSAIYFLISVIIFVAYMVIFPVEANIWDDFKIVPIICLLAYSFFFEAYVWYHFKSKGYHWSITILGMLIVTLIPICIPLMYFFLPDKYPIEY
jgi:hypothetical protein